MITCFRERKAFSETFGEIRTDVVVNNIRERRSLKTMNAICDKNDTPAGWFAGWQCDQMWRNCTALARFQKSWAHF